MAWRIHDSVIRGEIDNRERGSVRGRVWLAGQAEPLLLELKGNAWPDLAGCLLRFENPGKPFADPRVEGLNPMQRGTIGDLTASRKVRVFDLPIPEALERLRKGESVPEHMANCLYLEWYSDANGRVVIESTEYQLEMSAPLWQLSPEDEKQRQQQAAEGLTGFMQRLTEAVEKARHEPPEDKEWDEFDYEKFLRESDARSDKLGELMEKYRDHPDRDRIVAREMGWTWLEEALEEDERQSEGEPDPADDYQDSLDDEELMGEREPDPATEGVDWVHDEHYDVTHPLTLRVMQGAAGIENRCEELGLDRDQHPALGELLDEYHITGIKLAGALNTLAYGRYLVDGPFVVAYLKRALGHLHQTQAALDRVAAKDLLPAEAISATRTELFAIRERILALMQEFRNHRSE